MAEIEKKPVKIVETILRDAHQSLIATRMTTEQMLPIIEKMDQVGYHAVECWGGATFDASLRFLKEDPWERLRKFRDGFKNTKLQMLFRGQNILAMRILLITGWILQRESKIWERILFALKIWQDFLFRMKRQNLSQR